MNTEMNVVINKVPEETWREFLLKTPRATIYHTPEWKKVLEKSFGYKPYYLFVVDGSGNVLGLLPLMKTKSVLVGNRLSCLPLAHKCGYLGDPIFLKEILNRAVELLEKTSNTGTLEIRDTTGGHFRETSSFSTYVLELSDSTNNVWRKLDKSSVRWAIKKATKLGVNVEISSELGDIKLFYEINCQTKKKKGVPCHPLKFFKNLFKYIPQYSRLYLSKINGEIIGGGVMLSFKDTVIYGYGAAKDSMIKYHPYHAFLWKAIEDAINGGFRFFDFGRVHKANTGLADFKRRWGTKEIPLVYGYYPNLPTSSSLRNNKFLTAFVKHLPLPFYRLGSNWIFGRVV